MVFIYKQSLLYTIARSVTTTDIFEVFLKIIEKNKKVRNTTHLQHLLIKF